MPDLSVTKQTEIMHNFVPQIAKAVTDGSGTNVHGVLFEEGTELTYHLYVFNSDTAGARWRSTMLTAPRWKTSPTETERNR